ncbi:MAG: CHASE3 domain-containing protein, partial [Pseudomonadota bacterium]|nr:CHASE3 domain-containing protein [Pseudomonadota bacterium]
MKWPLSPTAMLCVISLLALLIGAAFVAFSTTSHLRETAAEVTRTHEVMDTLSRIHSSMADAQIGQRGYIITGLQSYLEPYRKATAKIQGELGQLAALTRENPRQQANLRSVQSLILEKVADLDRTVQIRNQEGFDRARDLVAEGEG